MKISGLVIFSKQSPVVGVGKTERGSPLTRQSPK
jgi:hypothetical protein